MDHYQLPDGKGHIKVPNLTTDKYIYTTGEGGFKGYPARCGWTDDDVQGKNNFGGRSKSEVASFFQSWMYFGFVIEILAIPGVKVQFSDLLDEDNGGKFVSTKRLPKFIREWGRHAWKMRKKPPRRGQRWEENIERMEWSTATGRIMKIVWDFIEEYSIPCKGPSRKFENPDTLPVPESVLMSITALGQTFAIGMGEFYEVPQFVHWGFSALLKRRMLSKGWCPMDVERSSSDLPIDGHYFLAKMKNPEVNISHELCAGKTCLGSNIEESSYKQIHVRGDTCNCGSTSISKDRLIEIIDSGAVPVFRWHPSTRTFNILSSDVSKRGDSDGYIPYIAISHVWSDGMGNPDANSILRCQADSIQALVDEAAAILASKSPDREVIQHFWMDTLCVPVDDHLKHLRNQCIRQMSSIYKRASGVLVLSSSVRKVATTSSDVDKAIALYTCNWNRRLWTYQEGFLAKELLFQFKDKVQIAEEIKMKGTYLTHGHCNIFPWRAKSHFLFEFGAENDMLKTIIQWQDTDRGPRGVKSARVNPLITMLDGLVPRSTSKMSDETICVGALLRLRLKPLVEVENTIRQDYERNDLQAPRKIPDKELAERRMEMFYKIVKVFPFDTIFNKQRRLPKEGFRWAPASLLGIGDNGFARLAEGVSPVFDKSRNCLAAKAPGLIFEAPSREGKSGPYTEDLIVEVAHTKGEEKLQLQIAISQVVQNPGPAKWTPGIQYGVIMARSFDDETKDITKFVLEVEPDNYRTLNTWFERLCPANPSTELVVDAAIGIVKDGGTQVSEDDITKFSPIDLRHEFLGTVKLLNPSAIKSRLQSNDQGDIDGWVTESDESESDSDLDIDTYPDDMPSHGGRDPPFNDRYSSGRDFPPSDDDTGYNYSGDELISPSEDSSSDSEYHDNTSVTASFEDLRLSDDYETASDASGSDSYDNNSDTSEYLARDSEERARKKVVEDLHSDGSDEEFCQEHNQPDSEDELDLDNSISSCFPDRVFEERNLPNPIITITTQGTLYPQNQKWYIF